MTATLNEAAELFSRLTGLPNGTAKQQLAKYDQATLDRIVDSQHNFEDDGKGGRRVADPPPADPEILQRVKAAIGKWETAQHQLVMAKAEGRGDCIKAVRFFGGLGLQAAREVVDSWSDKERLQVSEITTAARSQSARRAELSSLGLGGNVDFSAGQGFVREDLDPAVYRAASAGAAAAARSDDRPPVPPPAATSVTAAAVAANDPPASLGVESSVTVDAGGANDSPASGGPGG